MVKSQGSWLTGIGAAVAALLAHIPCCGLNLALILGTASSSSALAGITPFRGWFIGASLILSAVTLWMAFKPHKAHACGDCCQPASHDARTWFKKGAAVVLAGVSLLGIFLAPAGHVHTVSEGRDHSDHAGHDHSG